MNLEIILTKYLTEESFPTAKTLVILTHTYLLQISFKRFPEIQKIFRSKYAVETIFGAGINKHIRILYSVIFCIILER